MTAIGIPNLVGLALGQGGETGPSTAAFSLLVILRRRDLHTLGVPQTRRVDQGVRRRAAGVGRLAELGCSLVCAVDPSVRRAVRVRAAAGRAVALSAYFILGFMPSAVQLTSALGFRPAATALGIRHTLRIDGLVR